MPITVNGLEWFVTENLYLALLYMRDESQELTLWVDALCESLRVPLHITQRLLTH